jgi:GT2 family glycosyltransferase
VLYNTPIDEVERLYKNIIKTMPNKFEYDIFLINNSPENTELSTYLEGLECNDSHVRYLQPSKNDGFGAGHNMAIRIAESDYHILVNPDITIPNSSAIDKLVGFMNDRNVVLCNPKILNPKMELQKLVKHAPSILDMGLRFVGNSLMKKRQKWFVYDTEYDKVHEAMNLSGSFMVCNTHVLKNVGGFDERYFLYMEDADLTRTMAEKGATMYYPGAYVIHDWQRQNRKSVRGILTMLNSMRKYFDKWGWKLW